ncbi:MAG: CDP-alcohol phosphatidyltransferase family protein [Bacteroidetes bacterium]|nr:CDP-alcohol phosphatidyltransferase family protein [Bacteroidota bacterium]
MNIKKHIPNALTCSNLLCGCMAIVQAMNGNLVLAAYLVGLAAIFDFFDGFAARLLKVSSPIGKDLDSLADMVTFGVVPGIMMFQMLINATHIDRPAANGWTVYPPAYVSYLPYIAFIIPVFSAIRLAKFNNDPRQSDSFIGVPTPANAMLIAGLALIHPHGFQGGKWTIYPPLSAEPTPDIPWMEMFLFSSPVLIAITIIFAFLLVSELPLIALKFKHFKWKGNEIRFIFLILCILLLSTLQLVGIPLCIVLYILVSVINNLLVKKAQNTA